MTLKVYNYYSAKEIENIFCWVPDEPQWRITGFNPDFDNPKPKDMVTMRNCCHMLSNKAAKVELLNVETRTKLCNPPRSSTQAKNCR
jgi:hypothetical protein